MKAISALLVAMFAMAAYAQTEITTIPVEADSTGVEYTPVTDPIIPDSMFVSAPRFPAIFYPDTQYYKPYESATFQIRSLSVIPGQSNLYRWSNGSITAAGAEMDMPGLMHIDNGAIGVAQNYENISLYLGAEANKYGFFQGVHTQYGLTGNISYYFSPHLSFTAYGTYYFGAPPVMNCGLPMSAGMVGYYQRSTFGGYMNYRINDRFGILIGGQAVQRTGTNKYQFEPIVTPYFKVGKVAIGLPVGQMLNGIIREQTKRRSSKHYQIPPPKR